MMDMKHATLLDEIAMKKELTDEMIASLNAVLTDFTASFKASLTV